MKKIISFLLTFGMITAICGCGSISVEQSSGKVDKESSIVEQQSSDNEKKEEFSLGVIEGDTYKNKFIGVGCKLDSDWTFYSDEQIKELNNITTDIAGEEYENILKDATIIYDMYASNNTTGCNMNVNMEKLNAIQNKTLDVKKNYEYVAPLIVSTFENMGYTDIKYEIKDIEIDGKTMPVIYDTAVFGGETIHQISFGIKCDGYLANIAVTAFSEDELLKILDKFYFV